MNTHERKLLKYDLKYLGKYYILCGNNNDHLVSVHYIYIIELRANVKYLYCSAFTLSQKITSNHKLTKCKGKYSRSGDSSDPFQTKQSEQPYKIKILYIVCSAYFATYQIQNIFCTAYVKKR